MHVIIVVVNFRLLGLVWINLLQLDNCTVLLFVPDLDLDRINRCLWRRVRRRILLVHTLQGHAKPGTLRPHRITSYHGTCTVRRYLPRSLSIAFLQGTQRSFFLRLRRQLLYSRLLLVAPIHNLLEQSLPCRRKTQLLLSDRGCIAAILGLHLTFHLCQFKQAESD